MPSFCCQAAADWVASRRRVETQVTLPSAGLGAASTETRVVLSVHRQAAADCAAPRRNGETQVTLPSAGLGTASTEERAMPSVYRQAAANCATSRRSVDTQVQQQRARMTRLSGVPWAATQAPTDMMPLGLLPEE